MIIVGLDVAKSFSVVMAKFRDGELVNFEELRLDPRDRAPKPDFAERLVQQAGKS